MEAQTLDCDVHLASLNSAYATLEDLTIAAIRYCSLTPVCDVIRNVEVSDAREDVLVDAFRVTLLADTGKGGRHSHSCWERRRRLMPLQGCVHVVWVGRVSNVTSTSNGERQRRKFDHWIA